MLQRVRRIPTAHVQLLGVAGTVGWLACPTAEERRRKPGTVLAMAADVLQAVVAAIAA